MGCYAAQLGDCSGPVTKEHFVSRSALIVGGGELLVSGFPWQEDNQSTKIGIDSLVSKVLCARHNNNLSPLDESGTALLAAVKSIFTDATNTNFHDEVFELQGNRIELWLLKILCGVLASQNKSIPQRWIEILFARSLLPSDSGLYLFGEQGKESTWFFQLVRVHSVIDRHGKIAGAKFGIGGLAFLLAFGKPVFSESTMSAFYRPNKIIFEKDNKLKQIVLSWESGYRGGSIRLRIDGAIDSLASIPRPIVLPYQR